MSVTIKYFGAIAEATGVAEETVALDEIGGSVELTRSYCLKKYVAIEDLSFQLAVNQKLTNVGSIKDGDEIAFLPPFAGG